MNHFIRDFWDDFYKKAEEQIKWAECDTKSLPEI